jgi:hypothetical protein
MIIRISKLLAFTVGLIIVTPCVLEWIIRGRNTGMFLMEWAIEDDF